MRSKFRQAGTCREESAHVGGVSAWVEPAGTASGLSELSSEDCFSATVTEERANELWSTRSRIARGWGGAPLRKSC
jgi:hypothetical protein